MVVTTRTMNTTTLSVTRPVDYNSLESQFKLVRYVIPEGSYTYDKKNGFARLHNTVKEQLDNPYKSYKFDTLDDTRKWVVYVLYPRAAEPKEIYLEVTAGRPVAVEKCEISFKQIELHILLKLLQITYFLDLILQGQFVGRDECYVYAKRGKGKGQFICLQIEIKGDPNNRPENISQQFRVVSHAKTFIKELKPISKGFERIYTYYSMVNLNQAADNSLLYFKQVKQSKVQSTTAELFSVRTTSGTRTTLDYHSDSKVESSRGKILNDFIGGFCKYLVELGFTAYPLERTFYLFDLKEVEPNLPLERLEQVYLYDNRLSRQHQLEAYQKLLTGFFPEIKFQTTGELNNDLNSPVVVIQDCRREDFDGETGILGEEQDPYRVLYQEHVNVPKQTFNVNGNKAEEEVSRQDYLNYPMLSDEEEGLKTRLTVILNELYLKEAIIHNRKSVDYPLPLLPVDYAFVHRKTFEGISYEVLLYFLDSELHLIDCHAPEGKQKRAAIARSYGLDWDVLYEKMCKRRKAKQAEGDSEDRFGYYVTLEPSRFIEIEDNDERVLYRYDEIIRRQHEREQPHPYEYFKLAKHYEQVRPKTSTLPFEAVERIMQTGAAGRLEDKSRELYEFLLAFDDKLDELCKYTRQITLNELSTDRFVEELAPLLGVGLKRNKKNKYELKEYNKKLTGYYQRMGRFASSKQADLLMYQGIWFTDDNSYIVGATDSLKDRQPRAHLIRHFYDYNNEKQVIDIRFFLGATGVKFVRYNQYTVYPFYFHLIDLFIENILRFS